MILSRPLWSFISCPSLLLLSRSLGSRLVLRRSGSVGRLPHSLCPSWPQLQGLQGSTTVQEPRDGGRRGGPSLRMGGGRTGERQPSPPPPCFLPPTNRKSAASFHGDGAGLVGWTSRQGRDRGKSFFLVGSQPSTTPTRYV